MFAPVQLFICMTCFQRLTRSNVRTPVTAAQEDETLATAAGLRNPSSSRNQPFTIRL